MEQRCDWSEEEGGRGIVYPERLAGGEDFLLVASEGHAHSEQVSMETVTKVIRLFVCTWTHTAAVHLTQC